MIRREDDDRVLLHVTLFQNLEQFPDIVIHVAHSSKVSSTSASDSLVWDLCVFQTAHVQQPLTMRILLFPRYVHTWRGNVFTFIAVPVLPVNGIGVVWVGQGDCEAEGAGRDWSASLSIEVSSGFIHDFFVEIELVRSNAGASLEDGGFIMVPFEAPIWFVPIDGPLHR